MPNLVIKKDSTMIKAKTRNVLYLAGAVLLTSALVSQFKEAKLIWSTVMVFGSVLAIIWGLKEDKKLYGCYKKGSASKLKIFGIMTVVVLVFFGLGFSIGKLTYLWLH